MDTTLTCNGLPLIVRLGTSSIHIGDGKGLCLSPLTVSSCELQAHSIEACFLSILKAELSAIDAIKTKAWVQGLQSHRLHTILWFSRCAR